MNPRPPRISKLFRPSKRTVNAANAFYGLPAEFQTKVRAAPVKREKPAGELTELQEQIRVISWWDSHCSDYALPAFALFAIPNGGSRGLFEAANMKRSGVRPGVPDLFLSVPRNGFHGLFIEMKISTGVLSAEQDTLMAIQRGQGYEACVCWSHSEAIARITEYLQ